MSEEIFRGSNEEFRNAMREYVIHLVRQRARRAELTGGERVQLHPRHIRNHIKSLQED